METKVVDGPNVEGNNKLVRRKVFPLMGGIAGGAALAPIAALAETAKNGGQSSADPDSLRKTAEVAQLIIRERSARDLRKWDEFKDAYFEDSKVEVSWFKGTGWEFVEVTKKAFANTDIGVHLLNAIDVHHYNNRAIATATVTIVSDWTIGAPCTLFRICVFYFGVEKRAGKWGIVSFDTHWDRDYIVPKIPGDKIEIDRELLATFRPSYQLDSYASFKARGIKKDQNLPGVDRPETIKKLRDRLDNWMMAT